MLDVKVDKDGDGNDGEVDGKAKPGEEGALIGAVVAGIGRDVRKQ